MVALLVRNALGVEALRELSPFVVRDGKANDGVESGFAYDDGGTIDDGRLADSADENLRHGTAVLEVIGGMGQFEGATGRITSNFVPSATGDLTDNQFGLVFLRR